jgi:hypothetical protein
MQACSREALLLKLWWNAVPWLQCVEVECCIICSSLFELASPRFCGEDCYRSNLPVSVLRYCDVMLNGQFVGVREAVTSGRPAVSPRRLPGTGRVDQNLAVSASGEV